VNNSSVAISEGDDHVVLDRWDRRVATTIILFVSALIPAIHYSDVGLVLAFTGTVAATSLTYFLPGVLFIGVHGDEFLELVESRWGCKCPPHLPNDHFTTHDYITWYLFFMPVWCGVATMGKRCLAFKALQTPTQNYRLGKIMHKYCPTNQQRLQSDANSIDNELAPIVITELHKQPHVIPVKQTKQYNSISSSVEEDYPQDEKQTAWDFLIAIGFVIFGLVALSSGMLSIMWSIAGDD
jgi:hypothetical protein